MSRQAGWTTPRLVLRCLDARFWLMRFLPVLRRPILALMHYLVGAKTPDFRRPQPHCREKLGSPVAAVGAGGGEVSGRPRLHRPLRSDGRHHDRGRRGDDLEVPRVGGIPPEGQRAGLQAGQARARGAWAHGLLLLAPAPACGTGTCLRSAPSPPSAHRAPFIPVNWDGAVPDLVVPQNAVVLARDHQVRPQDLESKPAGDLDGDVWRCILAVLRRPPGAASGRGRSASPTGTSLAPWDTSPMAHNGSGSSETGGLGDMTAARDFFFVNRSGQDVPWRARVPVGDRTPVIDGGTA